jgi:hypothetical protein
MEVFVHICWKGHVCCETDDHYFWIRRGVDGSDEAMSKLGLPPLGEFDCSRGKTIRVEKDVFEELRKKFRE